MSTSDTSRRSYKELRESGALKTKREEVLMAMLELEARMGTAGVDYHEVMDVSGLKHNNVTGRINELRDADLVEIAGKKPNPLTGKLCQTYCLTAIGEIKATLISKRKAPELEKKAS